MRLIDADKLRWKLLGFERWTGIDEAPYEYAEDVLDREPTVDAVPVIRCKDCKYWTKPYGWNGWCDKHSILVEADDFCSLAERKEE